jgi:signal transduction histidine kinase
VSERTTVVAPSGTWLAELSKMGLAVRALALLLTLIWLPGAVDVPILLACIFCLTATTAIALLRWDRAAPRITRRPTLFALDLVLATFLLVVAGPESPFFLFTLATAALAGLLYGAPGAALFGAMLAGGYLVALDLSGVLEEDDSFQQLVGIPVLHLVAAAGGAAVRRLFARQTTAERTAAGERERARLARDMHDSLAKTVHGLALAAAAVARRAERDPAGAAQAAARLAADAEEAGREARGLIQGLRDGSAGRPLHEVVAERARAWSGRWDVPADLDLDPRAEAGPRARHELLRILDEALENAGRHAGATRLGVSLRAEAGELVLRVRDDGRGFAVPAEPADAAAEGRFGLVGMRERARFAGGDVTLESRPGEGCTVVLRLPAAAGDGRAEGTPAAPEAVRA